MWMVCGCACAAAVKRTPLWCRLSPRCFAGSLGSKRRSSGLHAMCLLPVSHLMNPPSYCGVGRILLIRLGWMARELQEPSCGPSSAMGLQMHHHAQLSRGAADPIPVLMIVRQALYTLSHRLPPLLCFKGIINEK